MLNAKQQRFVSEYLIDLNATAAAIRAGYSAKTAQVQAVRLMGVPAVASAIQAGVRSREARTGITQDFVLSRLRENLDRAMQAVPVLNAEGNELGVWKCDLNAANKALELLGRHTGAWERRIALPLPKLTGAASAVEAAGVVVEAVAAGTLSPGEGQAVIGVVDSYRRILEVSELGAEFAALRDELEQVKASRSMVAAPVSVADG